MCRVRVDLHKWSTLLFAQGALHWHSSLLFLPQSRAARAERREPKAQSRKPRAETRFLCHPERSRFFAREESAESKDPCTITSPRHIREFSRDPFIPPARTLKPCLTLSQISPSSVPHVTAIFIAADRTIWGGLPLWYRPRFGYQVVKQPGHNKGVAQSHALRTLRHNQRVQIASSLFDTKDLSWKWTCTDKTKGEKFTKGRTCKRSSSAVVKQTSRHQELWAAT